MSPTPRPCVKCGKTHSSHGNPVVLAVRGERKGWCRSCRARADCERRAVLTTAPCKKCGRTHANTGTPLDIAKSGEWAGHCGACRKVALRAARKPALSPADAQTLRAYHHYIARRRARLARTERRNSLGTP